MRGAFEGRRLDCVLGPAAFAVLLVAGAAAAQGPAALVRDLAAGDEAFIADPRGFHRHGDRIYFAASQPASGSELWVTDGETADGTLLVLDARPGPADFSPSSFVSVDERLVFRGRSDGWGTEIWSSDGTAGGTGLLVDLAPGPDGFVLGPWPVGGEAIFFAESPDLGIEPWRTDGTPAGTSMLRDIFPGPTGSVDAGPDPVVLGDLLIFLARDPTGGLEPWRTDGTAAGTYRLADIAPGPDDVDLRFRLFAGATHVWFSVHPSGGDVELWRTDGSPAGTELVTAIPEVLSAQAFCEASGRVLLVALHPAFGTEPWVSDGTAGGTRLLADVNPGPGDSRPGDCIEWNGEAWLGLDDGVAGRELWRTTGMVTGLRRAFDIEPGPGSSDPGGFFVLGDRLLFDAADPPEMMSTDGIGIQRLAPVPRTWAGGFVLDVEALFVSTVLEGGRGAGEELWRTDGRIAGTRRVATLGVGGAASQPEELVDVGSRLAFTAWDPAVGHEPRTSDGTAEGTRVLADLEPGPGSSAAAGLTLVGRSLAFLARTTATGLEPWFADILTGEARVADLLPGPTSSTTAAASWRGSFVVTAASDDALGLEPRVLAPPNGEVTRVHDLWPGVEGSNPAFHVTDGTSLFFQAWQPDGTFDPWVWTAPELEPRRIPVEAGDADLRESVAVTGRLFFEHDTDALGAEPWVSDGTGAGTFVLADVAPGRAGSRPRAFTTVGDRVFFVARSLEVGEELWVTDGTPEGTRLLEIFPGRPSSAVSELTAVGDTLWFAANDGSSGQEPWVSDGTLAGTALVADICRGGCDSRPSGFVEVDGSGLVLFAAGDALRGREPWLSDGTAAGTSLFQDLRPGPASSSPTELTAASGRIFLTADDGETGFELWSVPVGSGAVPDGRRVDGVALRASRETDGSLRLDFAPSCNELDTDYAVYRGELGDFGSSLPVACTTAGAITHSVEPTAGSQWYVVVPHGPALEGSPGRDSLGRRRPVSGAPCFPRAGSICD